MKLERKSVLPLMVLALCMLPKAVSGQELGDCWECFPMYYPGCGWEIDSCTWALEGGKNHCEQSGDCHASGCTIGHRVGGVDCEQTYNLLRPDGRVWYPAAVPSSAVLRESLGFGVANRVGPEIHRSACDHAVVFASYSQEDIARMKAVAKTLTI
jgi:hypothetical protein